MQRREDILCLALKKMSDKSERWGLNAIGVGTPFEVCLDERLDKAGWQLELSSGATKIRVDLNSPKEVTLIRFHE